MHFLPSGNRVAERGHNSKVYFMNNDKSWPLLGQAAASRVAQILAQHACWNLAAMPADLGMPLAAFLHDEAALLLIAVTDDLLPPAAAAVTRSLLDTRSDGLIIANERDPWFPPQMALGKWASGRVTWHLPMLPWADEAGAIWLTPASDISIHQRAPAFKLIAGQLKPSAKPWVGDVGRLAGLDRATTILWSEGV